MCPLRWQMINPINVFFGCCHDLGLYFRWLSSTCIQLNQGFSDHSLKEKLPQAFMQIGWMEDGFRNLTAKVWANLVNQSRDVIFKGFVNFVYVALSGGTLLIYVMSQQYNCLMELYTNFYKMLLFMKMYIPSSFVLRYVRAEINVHAFMNELGQNDYWYPRTIKNCENLCTKSMESCHLVISHILAEFHPERATYTTLHNHFS